MPFEGTCATDERILATIGSIDREGNPAPLDGSVTASVESGDGTIEPGTDPNTFWCSGNTAGDVVFKFSADAHPGEGVREIDETLTLHITAPEAQSLTVGLGDPQPRP